MLGRPGERLTIWRVRPEHGRNISRECLARPLRRVKALLEKMRNNGNSISALAPFAGISMSSRSRLLIGPSASHVITLWPHHLFHDLARAHLQRHISARNKSSVCADIFLMKLE